MGHDKRYCDSPKMIMKAVTVSQKYQVVIPQKVRKLLNIRRGQKMQVIAYDNRVVYVPMRPIQKALGSLKGMDTRIQRDEDPELYGENND